MRADHKSWPRSRAEMRDHIFKALAVRLKELPFGFRRFRETATQEISDAAKVLRMAGVPRSKTFRNLGDLAAE
jgi:hypothetical protein